MLWMVCLHSCHAIWTILVTQFQLFFSGNTNGHHFSSSFYLFSMIKLFTSFQGVIVLILVSAIWACVVDVHHNWWLSKIKEKILSSLILFFIEIFKCFSVVISLCPYKHFMLAIFLYPWSSDFNFILLIGWQPYEDSQRSSICRICICFYWRKDLQTIQSIVRGDLWGWIFS